MRSFIIITVLSALAACYGTVLPSEEKVSRGYTMIYDDISPDGRIASSVELESISNGYVLLSWGALKAPAVAGQIQYISKVYKAEPGNTISSVVITHSIPPALVLRTPLGRNSSKVSITSYRGQGINATISTYGRE
ncbi:hypothetical protein HF086_012048 [Spodoptera exigua]|uniref:Uncharacterized protein n=1 Tax=Spodoptera exigua TaxID=7107 RepID=A0A922MHR7_SPOEX|nr:hypothetical protein HF086_012048 [Spodoptera exigua]